MAEKKLKTCKACGKKFMGFSTAKTCSTECKKEYERNRAAIKRIKAREQQEKSKKSMSDLAKINAEARALGISYGKYSDMLRMEQERAERKGAASGKAR